MGRGRPRKRWCGVKRNGVEEQAEAAERSNEVLNEEEEEEAQAQKRKLENGSDEAPEVVQVKRQKVSENESTPAAVRCSSRLTSVEADAENENTEQEASGGEMEEQGEEEIQHLPEEELPVPPLPPSSASLNVSPDSVTDLLSVYSFLRSFSSAIFLSPFTLDAFIQSLHMRQPNNLIDHIHLSLLLLLRRHLEELAKEGSEAAIKASRCRDWKLLDLLTWPSYLVLFLLSENFSRERHGKLADLGIPQKDYYELEPSTKISVLSFLCDRALDTEAVRTELATRINNDICLGSTSKVEDCDWDVNVKNRTRSASKRSEADESAATPVTGVEVPASDFNSDDCVLCGMDGNLLCCDGCPAAYHSRCVGVTKASLPEGDWYCPECALTRSTGSKKQSNGLRGFERLGRDRYGRRYLIGWDHLFISESSDMCSNYACYSASDIQRLAEYLEQQDPSSFALRKIILSHLPVLEADVPEGPKLIGPCSTNEAAVMLPDEKRQRTKQTAYRGGHQLNSDAFFYVNHYALGASAALAASFLTEREGRKGGDGTTAQKTQVAEQIKAFCQAPVQFSWPSFRKKITDASRDRCGWCIACKSMNRKKGCLLNLAAGKLSAGAGGGVKPLRRGVNHLASLAAYVLYMEERLNGLLSGPWESMEHRRHWRNSVERAETFQEVKNALLQLGSHLRPVALSKNWTVVPEETPRLSMIVNSSGIAVPTPRRVGRPRKVQIVDPAEDSLWRKGGRVARQFLDWETLPNETLKRAARQGGAKHICGLLYTDSMDLPRRTAECAWRARVESSSSVSGLSIQVRYLDALVRWADLSVPEEVITCIISSGNVDSLIRSKTFEGNSVLYSIASSKTEDELRACLKPPVVSSPFKFVATILGEGSQCVNNVQLPEAEVPLCLVRDFEERSRVQRPGPPLPPRKKTRKLPKAQKFNRWLRVLIKNMEAAENALVCKRCNMELDARVGIRCYKCEGKFHSSCMSRFQTDVCSGCFTINQSKRSKRPTIKASNLRRLFPNSRNGEANQVKQKQLLVYTRRRSTKSLATSTLIQFGGAVIRKKRSKTHVNSTGVQWKRSRDAQVAFGHERVLLPGHAKAAADCPTCAICHQPYDASLLYLGCTYCHLWYHGDAVGVASGNLSKVASFKCHRCRKKGGPVCPYSGTKENVTPLVVDDNCLSRTTLSSELLLSDDCNEEDDAVLSEICNS